MTRKEEILERLLKEKFISFEEMLVLQEKEKEIVIERIVTTQPLTVNPITPYPQTPVYPTRNPWWLPEVIC